MSRRADPLIAIVNAARHVAAERIERAAAGKLPRLPTLLAAVALDATHAYLKLYGEEGEPAEDMGVIRCPAPEPQAHHVDVPEQTYVLYVPTSEHGPN